MKTSSKKNVQLLLHLCVNYGLKHVVISPGSRNAPLIIAFNQHPDVECIVVPDERSAAFIALGMAQQLGAPVGIVCTSGSAPLNYYPAIAEAYYQRIPLLVISADRPKSWVNQGDGQTIVQEEVFKNHINYSFSFDDSNEGADYQWMIRREIATAFNKANGISKGPVHINVAFSEPLYGTEEITQFPPFKKMLLEERANVLSQEQLEHIRTSWKSNRKKMIICGQLAPNSLLEEQLKILAKDPSVAVLVENTSNLIDDSFIHCIDRSLNSISEAEKADFSPDLLITIGGAVVSKRIKAYLRSIKPLENWKIGFDFPYMDTYQSLSHSFLIDESHFIMQLNQLKPEANSAYGLSWKEKDRLIQEKKRNYFKAETKFSDLTVYNCILNHLPENSHLHMGNSSVVRYCQLFDPIHGISYWCNRGTSGIDGSTSTAVGAALINKTEWNTLISGDMSFFYDSNALWNHVLTPNLRIFLINNGGGGIFKIIPGPASTAELDEFFVFNNSFSAKHLCANFNIGYVQVDSLEDMEKQVDEFYAPEENGRPKLMEIFTHQSANEVILEEFFNKVRL